MVWYGIFYLSDLFAIKSTDLSLAPLILRIKYIKMRFRENPCSSIFYAVSTVCGSLVEARFSQALNCNDEPPTYN